MNQDRSRSLTGLYPTLEKGGLYARFCNDFLKWLSMPSYMNQDYASGRDEGVKRN